MSQMQTAHVERGGVDGARARLLVRRRPSRSGRWWVMLHGAAMTGEMFADQWLALPADDGILCWDARGHGRSSLTGRFRFSDAVDDARALLETIEGEVVLVGQSMGGNLAQVLVDEGLRQTPSSQAAVDHAGPRIVGLVVIDCVDNAAALSAGDRAGLRLTGPILAALPWRFTVTHSAASCGHDPAVQEYSARSMRQVGKRRFVQIMNFWRDALHPDPDRRLAVPTLAVLGADDRTGTVKASMTGWPERDPAVELAVIEGARHNSNMDQPAAVNEALLAFAARC